MKGGIEIFGRVVHQITSDVGRETYYDFKNYSRGCCAGRQKRVFVPSKDEALEFIKLQDFFSSGRLGDDRMKYRRYRTLKNDYDWRTKIIGEEGARGLKAPTGDIVLPAIFHDVFAEFDAVQSRPGLIPVSNGKAWGIVTSGENPLLVVDFRYANIIPERWGDPIFFVQDMETGLWGALTLSYEPTNLRKPSMRFNVDRIVELMPPIAEAIYEDQLFTECAPTIFWMITKGDRAGVLTRFRYSEIKFETLDDDYIIKMIGYA